MNDAVLNNLSHYADILAIPFFALAAIIILRKPNKTKIDYLLFAFFTTGFIADLIFSIHFLQEKRKNTLEPLTLTKVHSRLREHIRVLNNICTTHDIQYWADGGTLLGAIREKGFIPYDDDMDVCFYETDFNRLKEAIKDYPEYEIIVTDFPMYKFVQKKDHRIFIDLFIVEDYTDKYREEIVRLQIEKHREQWPKCYHKKIDLFPLQKIKFEKTYLWIPKDPIPYLERAYGDWKTPVKWSGHIID